MSVTNWWAALLCGAALALPVAAQEEPVPTEPPSPTPPVEAKAAPAENAPEKKGVDDPPLHRWGAFKLSVAGWNPQLLSADEEIAATSSGGITSPLNAGSHAEVRALVGVAYLLPHDAGSIVFHYAAMEHLDDFEYLTPGQFGFVESRGFPLLLGAFDDGLADGVRATTIRRTHEFRLDFSKRAFDSPRARGTWAAGVRELHHDRLTAISYLAIVPNLPPLIPPIVPDTFDPSFLAPHPDLVSQASSFSGNGIGASLDVEFPLHPRVSVISGIALGLIRGRAGSQYTSQNAFYFSSDAPTVPLTKSALFTILTNGPPAEILKIDQGTAVTGVYTTGVSRVAETLDIYVGLEATLYRGLKIFAALRELYYENVGEYVVPNASGSKDRTALSAGYEGYTVGLSWRY